MSKKSFIQKYVDEVYEVVNKSDNQHYKIYAIMVYLKGRNVYSEKLYNEAGIEKSNDMIASVKLEINSVKLNITSAKLEDLVLSVKLGNEYKDKKIADESLEVENDNDYQYSVYDLKDMKKSIEAYHQWIQIRIEEYGRRERMLEQLKNMPIVQEIVQGMAMS